MRNAFVFPNYKIQSGPGCSIWFVGQMLVFLDKKNETFNRILKKKHKFNV